LALSHDQSHLAGLVRAISLLVPGSPRQLLYCCEPMLQADDGVRALEIAC
jgi:hypothetical protein